MNLVVLIGNITKDIELRRTQTGIPTCVFTVAVNGGKSKDGTQITNFPTVVCWNNLAESCAKYLKKGSKVGVYGKLQTRSYEKDKVKHFVTEIVADNVEFLTPKPSKTMEQEGYV